MEKPKLIIQSINDQKMGEIQGQTVVEPGSDHKGKSFKFLEMFSLRIGPSVHKGKKNQICGNMFNLPIGPLRIIT